MHQLTPEGKRVVEDLANRHGFSADAVAHMMVAVLHGNGSMAQFDHREFSGSGQWMRGGMIMLGNMFDNHLKSRVDGLCSEIANILANQPGLLRSGSFQSQSQGSGGQQQRGGGGQHQQHGGVAAGTSSLFVPDPDDHWWPGELGAPNATGAQNNVRYAYFANAHRLAVKTGTDVWVYDTLNHQIGGFSQQQGGGGSITFSSQLGTVNLATLPVVFRNGQRVAAPGSGPAPVPAPAPPLHSAASSVSSNDVLAAIEKLGDLRDKGVLSDEEFTSKKAELLARL